MNENEILFTHPAKKLCPPSQADLQVRRRGGESLGRLQHRRPLSPPPQSIGPSLQASGFSSGTGLTTCPVSGTPSTPPLAHVPHAICPVAPASAAPPGSSPLSSSTLYGLTWGPEHLSPACAAPAPLQPDCSSLGSLLLPRVFLPHSLIPSLSCLSTSIILLMHPQFSPSTWVILPSQDPSALFPCMCCAPNPAPNAPHPSFPASSPLFPQAAPMALV